MTAPIVARQVSKSFYGREEVRALLDVSLEIRAREFVSVLGPSGCGKSTLLRIVAGLIPADRGELRTSGTTGVVFQTHNMLPWLTVTQNMELGAKMRGIAENEIRGRVERLTETLSLRGFGKSYPHQLSGGMRQRAAIGQILALEPAILLMDEPFGALDALTRDRLNVELLRIWQERMQTVLFITHSIAEAVFLSDRVLVMSARPGRILHEVTIDLPRPRSPEAVRTDPRFAAHVAELSQMMGVY